MDEIKRYSPIYDSEVGAASMAPSSGGVWIPLSTFMKHMTTHNKQLESHYHIVEALLAENEIT